MKPVFTGKIKQLFDNYQTIYIRGGLFVIYQMTKTTYQQTIREIGNSKYILVPSDFVNHASLENGKQYKVTLEEIEEERDE